MVVLRTKHRSHFVGTEVVVGEVKQEPQFLREQALECLNVLLPHQSI